MADNYLITGYWGEPHVTAENDRGINAGIFGTGRFVLPVGSQFRAEYIGNNTIRMYDGKLLDNGAAAGIPAGLYVDLLIPEAGQGMFRNDIIAFKYKKDTLTLVETGEFVVVSGTESADTAADPELYQEDLMTNEATLDYMPLWRVPVSGATIGTPVQLFEFRMTGDRIIAAHSDDGINYTAHLHGLGALYNGLEITVIPDKNSVQPDIKLDLNGLGAKNVRMTLPFSSGNSGALAVQDSWFSADAPMTLRYHDKMNMWKSDLQRQSAQSLYGNVPASRVSYDNEASGLEVENVQEAIDELNARKVISETLTFTYQSEADTYFSTKQMHVYRFGRVVMIRYRFVTNADISYSLNASMGVHVARGLPIPISNGAIWHYCTLPDREPYSILINLQGYMYIGSSLSSNKISSGQAIEGTICYLL